MASKNVCLLGEKGILEFTAVISEYSGKTGYCTNVSSMNKRLHMNPLLSGGGRTPSCCKLHAICS